MNKLIAFLGFVLLIAACNGKTKIDSPELEQNLIQAQSNEFNPNGGYVNNVTTGDIIEPIINFKGDTIQTGKLIPINGKIYPSDSLETRYEGELSKEYTTYNELNIRVIPKNNPTIEINLDSLIRLSALDEIDCDACLSDIGDTIPTGNTLPVNGRIMPCIQPQAIKAGSPEYKHSASLNIQLLGIDQGLEGSYIRSIVEDRNGNIWLGSYYGGVSKYDGTNFFKYGEEEGLSNGVYAIVEDKNGNIWFGTKDKGVCMYNGKNFIYYSESEGLSSNYVYSMFEDRAGNIWIGNSEGVSKLSFIYGDDSQGKKDSSEQVMLKNYTLKEGIIDGTIRTITQDSKGNMWFGSWGGGICMVKEDDLKQEKEKPITFTHYTKKDGLVSNYINNIHEDKNRIIWFATGDGVSKLEREKKNGVDYESFTIYTEKEGLGGDLVYEVVEQENGDLWFGSYGKGASKYSHAMVDGVEVETFTVFTEEDGLSTNETGPHLIDSKGNIWFMAWGEGVSIIMNRPFKNYTLKDGLPFDRVYAIVEDDDGGIWIGTNGGGATKMMLSEDGNDEVKSIITFPQETNLSNDTYYNMLNDKMGNIWFGGRVVSKISHNAIGLSGKINGKANYVTEYYKKYALNGNLPSDIMEDRNGNIWIAKGSDLNQLIINGPGKGSVVNYSEDNLLSKKYFKSILEDINGNIWLASYESGLIKLSKDGQENSIVFYTEKEGLCDNRINILFEDKKGNIWIGTEGGLTVLHNSSLEIMSEKGLGSNSLKITHYGTNDGLSHNAINSIIEDNNGHIWVGTKSGLNEIVFNNDMDATNPGFPTPTAIRNYGKYDGLKGIDFIGNSVLLDSENRMWWGCTKSLNMLDLDKFKTSQNAPLIQLNSIAINERFMDYHNFELNDSSGFSYSYAEPYYNYPKNLELDHDKNHLTFYFSGIDWQASQKIEYSYNLEGLNEKWSKISNETKAEYRNIPYGDYIFKVRAKGESGSWSETFEYEFSISPPWWHSWWARVIYVIILFLGVLGFHQWRTSSFKKRQKELEDEIESATKEIRTQKEEVQKQKELAEEERERAVTSENFKHQFLANMSHEIRTPMNAIKGMSDILIRRKPKANQLKYLKGIKESSDSLLVIINDILDLSKIEVGKIELEHIPFSITDMINNINTIMHFKAEEKGLQMKSNIPADIPQLVGDPTRLRQIIINLLGNAIKFTERGIVTTSVKIEPTTDQNILNAHFIISDTGIGIDKDKLEQVFNSFEQAYSNTSRKFGGTGLGLSISKKLVEIQQGKIWAESEKGKGSQFHFTIPYPINQEEIIVPVGPFMVNFENIGMHLKGVRILLVDDNTFNIVVAQEELEDAIEEPAITTAENGAIAVELIRHNEFDLILMDVQMPIMNGYEATKKIRKLENEKASIPIIAMTANVMKEEVEQCYNIGMDDFIGKPFDTEELIQKIHRLVQKRG